MDWDDENPQLVGKYVNTYPAVPNGFSIVSLFDKQIARESPRDRAIDKVSDDWLMLNAPGFHIRGRVPSELPPKGGNRSPHRRHKVVDVTNGYGHCRACQRTVRVDKNGNYWQCSNARIYRQRKQRASKER